MTQVYVLAMNYTGQQTFNLLGHLDQDILTFRNLHKHISQKWNNTIILGPCSGTATYFSQQIHISIHCNIPFQPGLGHSNFLMVCLSSYTWTAGWCLSDLTYCLPPLPWMDAVLNFCLSIKNASQTYPSKLVFWQPFTPTFSMAGFSQYQGN